MSDVEPRFKDNFGECECGCGAWGPLKRAHRDGTRCVARKCTCKRCTGKRSSHGGRRKQSVAAKKLGVLNVADEERWHDPLFSTEVKSGKQVGPAATAWLRAKQQIDASRPDHGGQHKPARVVWMPSGWGSRGLVTVELDTWESLIAPALNEVYG